MSIKNKFKWLPSVLIAGLLFSGCEKEDDKKDDKTGELTLSLSGLSSLGKGHVYEGWLIVDGKAVTAGRFDVDKSSFSKTFSDVKNLEKATAYVLTIEPEPDSDPKPTNVHILAGDFKDKSASLTIGHKSALGNDFTTAKGTYILATPSDGLDTGAATDTNPTSGVWWATPPPALAPSLTLPVLPNGWKYEGWAVINNVPVSTGTFSAVDKADDKALFYDESEVKPPRPGEDFLKNAPTGLTFPTDLSGKKIVISVEPDPDNSTSPFVLKPLVGDVPATATTGTTQTMKNNATASNPSGKATRP